MSAFDTSGLFGGGVGGSGFDTSGNDAFLPALDSTGISAIAPTATSSVQGWSTLAGTLGNLGLGIFKTVTAANLASQQISAGQYPTVIGQNGQMAGIANVSTSQSIASSSSWLILVIVAVIVILLIAR